MSYELLAREVLAGSLDIAGVKDVPPSEAKLARVFRLAQKDYVRLSPVPQQLAVVSNAPQLLMASEPRFTAPALAKISVPVGRLSSASAKRSPGRGTKATVSERSEFRLRK